jgi:hypothetical protein
MVRSAGAKPGSSNRSREVPARRPGNWYSPVAFVVVMTLVPSSAVAVTATLAITAFDASVTRPLIPVSWANSGKHIRTASSIVLIHFSAFRLAFELVMVADCLP